MIKLDIGTLILVYILFSVIIILISWLFFSYKKSRRPLVKDVDYIWKCSVCLNTYIDSRHEDISICPMCGSYNKKEGVNR